MLFYDFSKVRRAVLVLAAAGCLAAAGQAQTPVLEVQVSNEIVPWQNGGGSITVYLTNYLDTIAAFNMWLQLDRPDVIQFVPTIGTHLQTDVVGSLTADWAVLDAHSISGTPYDAFVAGMADSLSYTGGTYIDPSSLPRPLFRLPFTFSPGVDKVPDPIATIYIYKLREFTSFARPSGQNVDGIDFPGPEVDTVKIKLRNGSVTAVCSGDGDVNYDGLVLTVADIVELARIYQGMIPVNGHMSHADLNGDCVIDSVDVNLFQCLFEHGMSCLPNWPVATCCNPVVKLCCAGVVGNIDCDPGNSVDISDLTALIDHLYISLSPLCCWGEANIDGQASIDISDLTLLIDNLYVSFTPLSTPACAQ